MTRSDLARNLDRARGFARDLDRMAIALGRALDHALDLQLDGGPDLDRCLDRCRDLIRDLNRARDLIGDLDRARDLDRDLDHALALTHDLDLAPYHGRDVGPYEELLSALQHASSKVNETVRLQPALASKAHASTEAESRAVEPTHWAGQLAQVAVRVLPAADRKRYSDEYRSELYELAAARVSRSRQLLHAVRLIDRAWVLRAELRAPAPRRART